MPAEGVGFGGTAFGDLNVVPGGIGKRDELLRLLGALKRSREEIVEQNRQLKVLAALDPLTECLNRRGFFPKFEALCDAAVAESSPLCGIMLDVDHFKSVNDTHGHAKGDEVLRGVAACLRREVSELGLVCRFGGEEFCLLLPNFSLEQAAAKAEEIRLAIAGLEFGAVMITASFGVSSIEKSLGNPQGLLEHADKCLFLAKRKGRNCVVCYSSDLQAIEVEERNIRRTTSVKNIAAAPPPHIPFPAVASLLSALAYRHAETAEHCARVADLCVATARGLMKASEAYTLEIAALLHDIGKIGVPDAILLKPGRLTPDEWQAMKLNERIGVEIVSVAFDYAPLVDIIRYHKSTYSGDAQVLHVPRGKQLPLGARILSIADAYDAMVSDRVFRKAMTPAAAFAELRRCAGQQFDPDLVRRFTELVASGCGAVKTGQPAISRQAAMHLGTQVQQLARALDEQDLTAIEALAGRLQATAALAGVDEVQSLAKRIHHSVSRGEDVSALFELTLELVDLCRLAQRSCLPIFCPESLPQTRG